MTYLICLDKPLDACSFEGFLTIWGWPCHSLIRAKVLGDRWLLFNDLVLLGIIGQHRIEVV